MTATTCTPGTRLAMERHTEGLIKEYTARLRDLKTELEGMPPHQQGDTMDTVVRCGLRGEIRETKRFIGVLRRRLDEIRRGQGIEGTAVHCCLETDRREVSN